MAFFNSSDASFSPLFRLLDDFSNHYSPQTARRAPIAQWQPDFDIRETEEAYELHGEFPGTKKENVHIHFTEPQTMLVHGKTERSYTSSTPPAGLIGDTQVSESAATSTDEKRKSLQSTVEDDSQDVSNDSVKASSDAGNSEPKEIEHTRTSPTKPADTAKYWVSERTVGEFSRSFHFPTRVDQDGVTANFKDGILTIVVPKAKKHESRHIAVN
ncbi:hypothetical protein G7Z17_g3867 [Cylindrodendrum hubeiense]|uniref:SHSP domain-containing protein n=1 Tax=Cylindrodendrum hubeiense TaxID=595255 RepID=A0A9P5HDU5_9HYPO|nr:hypothetical protein G7Z17_g3867 [Cylindrodendrum hubeiense]